jgi:hypothetical protein
MLICKHLSKHILEKTANFLCLEQNLAPICPKAPLEWHKKSVPASMMHVMPKGRRDAETAEVAEPAVTPKKN